MDEQKDRKAQQKVRKFGRAGKGKKEDFFIFIDDKLTFMKKPDMEKIITVPKMKVKGGRAPLKGGGICKRGMNRKAVGKNS